VGPSVTAYLALGSNVGDRAAHLRFAAGYVAGAPGVRLLAASPVFETDAVADEPQPPYLNAVLRVETDLTARALLAVGLAAERARGRVRPPGRARAPRTLDVDLLLYGDALIDEPGLAVPHPGLAARPFVRIPLAAVAAPGLRHPVTGERLDAGAPHPAVRPLSPPADLLVQPPPAP
jgi:2-amino-4-hydroxy-6-hydroxymethyldihydropteridine diphosphokinase